MKSFPPICIRKHSRITQNIARLQPFFLLIHNLEVSSFRNNFLLIRIWNHLLRQNPHPIHQRECFSVSMRIYNFRTLIIDHAHLKRFSFKKKKKNNPSKTNPSSKNLYLIFAHYMHKTLQDCNLIFPSNLQPKNISTFLEAIFLRSTLEDIRWLEEQAFWKRTFALAIAIWKTWPFQRQSLLFSKENVSQRRTWEDDVDEEE